MKKKIIVVIALVLSVSILCTGCQREADKVSYNLSKEADSNDW